MFISKSRPTPVLKYPIAPITLFFALGILAGNYCNLPLLYSCLLGAVAISKLLFTQRQSKKSFLNTPHFSIAAFSVAFCLGMIIQSLHYTPNSKLHYSHLLDGKPSVIKGIITERLKPDNYTEKYYFKVQSIDNRTATGTILLTKTKDSLRTHFKAGTTLAVAGIPLSILKPLNPYQFDYATYMQKQDVFHQLKITDNYIIAGTDYGYSYYIGKLRHKLVNSFAIHNFSPQVQNTLNALLLGQRQDMDPETNNAYKDAGVLHVLAISGLHFAVLFLVLTYVMRPLKRFKKKGRLAQLIILLSLLWGFALITGLSASVVRSVLMFTFISVGRHGNRNANIYNSISVSMLVLLVAEPNFLFDTGFQLSYLAVFAIVWLQPFYSGIKPTNHKVVNYLGDTVLVSLAAQIGVLPLSLFYFHRFPLLFLLANLVVIPLSNIVLVLGLFVLILNFICTDAAVLFGKALGFQVELMNAFISWVASFDNLILKDIPFTALLAILLYCCIMFFGLWLYKKNYKRSIALLASVVLFQLAFMATEWQAKNGSELIVFNWFKNTAIADKKNDSLAILTNDSLALPGALITSYRRASFNPQLQYKKVPNLLWHNNQKVLIIEKEGLYIDELKPDILILTQSAKINLERVIKQLRPKIIIADGSNYKNAVTRWKATCRKQKIPFHATAEKGFYMIE